MVKARKYVVKKLFKGIPQREDFEIVEHELPKINNGEVLVKVEWISVDRYLLDYQHLYKPTVPYDQRGYQVAIVEDTKDPRYPIGSRVVSHNGWCDYCVLNTANISENNEENVYKMPNLKSMSPSLALGVLGMPGATAYFGLLEICKPRAGDTVTITGAATTIGSTVGQIAKIKGCRVIGFTNSTQKLNWLKSIGFDFVFNEDVVDIDVAIKQSAPKGIDVYFDNVGGPISSTIINHMNIFGRVAVCGSKVLFNDSEIPVASVIQHDVVRNQVTLEGFSGWRWFERWPEAFAQLVKWISNGQLKVREHVSEGFENIYEAFLEELHEDNIGKAIVNIA